MERLALQKLVDWNDAEDRKPLIIWGLDKLVKLI